MQQHVQYPECYLLLLRTFKMKMERLPFLKCFDHTWVVLKKFQTSGKLNIQIYWFVIVNSRDGMLIS